MTFLYNGYVQDAFKALIYLVPLVYIVVKKRELNLRYFWLLFAGLLILFLGHLLDFSDEFKAIKKVFIIGKKSPHHDVFEDIVGFTLGFALFIVGIFLEFIRKKSTTSKNRP